MAKNSNKNTVTSYNDKTDTKFSVSAKLAEIAKKEREVENDLISRKKLLGPTVRFDTMKGILKQNMKNWARIQKEVIIEMSRPYRSKDQQEQHEARKLVRAQRRAQKRAEAKAA